MHLDEILAQGAVRTLPRMGSKKRLFCEIAAIAAECYGLDQTTAFPALQDREALGPTGVGQGVALPHARLPGLDGVLGVFARLETPLDFEATDRRPVDLVFALFAPEDAGVAHLKALALVSRTLRDQGLRDKLRANSDRGLLHTILTAQEASKAA